MEAYDPISIEEHTDHLQARHINLEKELVI